MTRRTMRLGRTVAVGVGASLLFVAAAAAAPPSGRAVIDDWYDNGRVDDSWSCVAVLDALTLLPEHRRPGYFSAQSDLERQVRVRCAGWNAGVTESVGDVDAGDEPTFYATDETYYETDEPIVTMTFQQSAGSDTSSGLSIDDLFPWGTAIVGIVGGGVAVMIGSAAFYPRLRPRWFERGHGQDGTPRY